MKKIFTLLLVLLPFFLFSQVQLLSHDATKIYPDDTRITYLTLSDYPTNVEFIEFVEKEVLTNTLIQRFKLAKDGKTCFYCSQKICLVYDEATEKNRINTLSYIGS